MKEEWSKGDGAARMYNLAEAAKLLGIDKATLRKAILSGQVKGVKIGSWLRVPEAEIERLCSPLPPPVSKVLSEGGL
jgi:excisionase family DNA binding protein